MESYVQVVADYDTADLATSEVRQGIWARPGDRDVHVDVTPVTEFNTVEAGFVVEQLAYHAPRPDDYVLYANVAPRADDDRPREGNEGEPLRYAELVNGVPIVGVDAGYTFAGVKDCIDDLYSVDLDAVVEDEDVDRDATQFRSRDIFPAVVAAANEDRVDRWLGERLDPGRIPDLPEDRVGYVDNFGNIKTSTPRSSIDLERGDRVAVEINGHHALATYAPAGFAVDTGETAFAPGSSGPAADPYMELFHRRGDADDPGASDLFDEVRPGDGITWEALPA